MAELGSKRYLGLITARAGSKRLPGKNLRLLGGISLVARTAIAAKESNRLTKLIISTDSETILREAILFGCAPHPLRPAHLAEDATQSLDVIRFELQRLEEVDEFYDAIVLLQPTSPLRTADDIRKAIQCYETSGANTVSSVGPDGEENGAVFVLSASDIRRNQFYGKNVAHYQMPIERSLDIDTLADFQLAETQLKES